MFLFLMIVGIFAQMIDGVLGMGYGASTSALLLGAGFLPASVSASVHASKIVTGVMSGLFHLRLGNVNNAIAWPLALGGVVGGVAGALLLSSLPGKLARPFIAALLLLLGLRILLRFLGKKIVLVQKTSFSRRFLLILGFFGGAVDAVGGGGWGPVCTSTLVSARRTTVRYVVGSVNFAEFFAALAITIVFALRLGAGEFLVSITLPLIIGGAIAAPVAALSAKRIPDGVMGIGVGGILIILNSDTLLRSIPGVPGDLWIRATGLAVIALIAAFLLRKRLGPAAVRNPLPGAGDLEPPVQVPVGKPNF